LDGIIDLTLPVKKHWKWMFNVTVVLDHRRGDPLIDEMLYMDVHSFTHMDAPFHAYDGKSTIDQVPLSDVIGEAKVIDLSDLEANTAITADILEQNGSHVTKGDIVVVKTCQGLKQNWENPEFWTTSPYMVESAGKWLIDKEVKTVGFDFPQDYVIRELFHGKIPTLDDMIIHKLLLGADMVMIEYITNMHLITTETFNLYAIPLKLEGISGAAARVFAVP